MAHRLMLALIGVSVCGMLGCVNSARVLPDRTIPYLLTRPAAVYVMVETETGPVEVKVKLRPGDVVADALVIHE